MLQYSGGMTCGWLDRPYLTVSRYATDVAGMDVNLLVVLCYGNDILFCY